MSKLLSIAFIAAASLPAVSAGAISYRMTVSAETWYPVFETRPAPFVGGGGIVLFDLPSVGPTYTVQPTFSNLTINGKTWAADELTLLIWLSESGRYGPRLADTAEIRMSGRDFLDIQQSSDGWPLIKMSAPGILGFYNATGDEAHLTLTTLPEPTAWTLMVLGFGLTGASVRRRKVSAAAA